MPSNAAMRASRADRRESTHSCVAMCALTDLTSILKNYCVSMSALQSGEAKTKFLLTPTVVPPMFWMEAFST